MPTVSRAISSLLNGVSQQPALARLPSQLEIQENCHSSLVDGLRRRPPWKHIKKLTTAGVLADYDSAAIWSVNRDNNTRYTAVIRSGAMEVFDTQTGAAQTLTTPDGLSYLTCSNPRDDLRLLTVEDFTFIVNRTKIVAMTVEAAPAFTYAGVVQKLSDLPADGSASVGKYYLIRASSDNPLGQYYVTWIVDPAVVAGPEVRTGYWSEIAKPGTLIAFDATTMPHALVSNSDGTFTFKKLTWDKRQVGDDTSVPKPSFVGRKIDEVFFARRRLGFLSGTRVNISKGGGDYFDYWREKGAQVLETDPIDFNIADEDAAGGFHAATALSDDVLFWSRKAQFRLTSSSTNVGLGPNTVDIRVVSKYNNTATTRPLVVGSSVYFGTPIGTWTQLNELIVSGDGRGAVASPVTDHVPAFVPAEVVRYVSSPESKLVAVLSALDRSRLFVWAHMEDREQRHQSSWSRWDAPKGGTILDITMDRWLLIASVKHADGVYLYTIDLSPSLTQPNNNFYAVHLDRLVTHSQCARTLVSGNTQILLPFTVEAGETPYLVPIRTDPSLGVPAPVALVPGVTPPLWQLAGDWTATDFFVGHYYASWCELSELFAVRAGSQDGVAAASTDDGRLVIQRMVYTTDRTSALAGGVWQKADDEEYGAYGRITIAGVPSAPVDVAPAIPSQPLVQTDGKEHKSRRSAAKIKQPVHMRRSRAIIRFGSIEQRPFYLTSARWHGVYSYSRQQV